MQYYRSAVALSLLFTCVCCAKNTKVTKPTLKTSLKTTLKLSLNTTLKTTVEPTLNTTMKTSLKPTLNATRKTTLTPTFKTTMKTTLKTTMKTTLDTTLNTTLRPWPRPSKMPVAVRTMSPMLMRFIPTVNNDTAFIKMGRDVESQEVPYIVALEFTGNSSNWFCAGTLLDHRWIVTVASCTHHAVRVKISYGAAQRSSHVRVVYVGRRSMFPHPKYDRDYANDIALIQMPFVKFSKHIGPVAIGHGLTFTLRWIYTSGWGQHRDTMKHMNQLHLMRIQFMKQSYCVKQGYGKRFRSSMLCARLPHVDTSCGLDSGSPLVMQSKCGLIGIASFGSTENCRNNTVLSYTRLNAYREWMASVMHKK